MACPQQSCGRNSCAPTRRAIALLGLSLAAAVGCSTAGGASSLFPNDYRLMKSAKAVAESARINAPIPRELQKRALLPYYVQPGDVLLIEPIELDTEVRVPADQPVLPDGTIDLAEYGRIVVAGLTIEEIEHLVHATIQSSEPDVDVEPLNVRLQIAESRVYYVLGEVNSPGAYPLQGRETVLDGLMAAGGLSDSASEKKIILSRPTEPRSCRIVLPVCYDRIVQLGDTTTNFQLQPGDRIYVGTRTFCEAIRFWQTGTPRCPDCACGCQYPDKSPTPPFAVEADPHIPAIEALPPVTTAPDAEVLPPAADAAMK